MHFRDGRLYNEIMDKTRTTVERACNFLKISRHSPDNIVFTHDMKVSEKDLDTDYLIHKIVFSSTY